MSDHLRDIASDMDAQRLRVSSDADGFTGYRLPGTPSRITCSAPACTASTTGPTGDQAGWTLGPNTAICPDHRPRLHLPVAAA